MTYAVVAASNITATAWQPITIVHSIVDLGLTESVTVRDAVPISSNQQQFFQLRVGLQ